MLSWFAFFLFSLVSVRVALFRFGVGCSLSFLGGRGVFLSFWTGGEQGRRSGYFFQSSVRSFVSGEVWVWVVVWEREVREGFILQFLGEGRG